MAFRKIFFAACLVAAVLCLAAGYGVGGKWGGAGMAALTGLAWSLAQKYRASWLSHLCLLVSIGLAVVGQLTGSPSLWMICSSGLALAVWDVFLLDIALGNNSSGAQTLQYEKKHLQSLFLALGSGLLVAFVGRLLTLQVPFVLLLLFVVLTVLSLDRAWGYLKKTAFR
jgi:hypothetical protein